MEKIAITDGVGNCCPACGSRRITRHEQRNLQVDVNLQTEREFKLQGEKIKRMTNRDKAHAFDNADIAGGGGCWSYECRRCGWVSKMFTD